MILLAGIDIEYELERKFIGSLRGIFEFDDKFIYNNNEQKTGIIITTDYPNKDVPGKVPHVILTSLAYEINMDSSFNRDYFGNIPNGQSYAKLVPYSLTLLCLGIDYESKDLANKVVDYITFTASDVFDAQNLNITHVSKGVSSPQEQYPEKVFGTPVTLNGNLNWVGKKETLPQQGNILNTIKINISNYKK